MCLVTWSLNEHETRVDLVLIETSPLFFGDDAVLMLISKNLCKVNKVNSSLTFIQRPGN